MASVADQGLGGPCKLLQGRASSLLDDTHQAASRIESNSGTCSPRDVFKKIKTNITHMQGADLEQGPERG